ncbi:GtrA family protein [Cedecea neteri]|uniref:GtrA family protein n=1 Tax=Cedecea neteri TaxID=158822 RepID=UPI0039E330BE
MFSVNQAAANFIAFAVAVSFSFFANAKFTFKSQPRIRGCFLFATFLSFMSLLVGKTSDYYNIHPIITLIDFSFFAFFCGFFFSKFVFFKESE